MNFKELQNNFKIRYNTNIPPKCTFVGKPLFLLGDVICNFDFPSLSTALSVGTALAFDISADNSNHIQENNNNLCYSCKSGNGSGYHTENYSKTIFKTIDKLESDFNISFSGLNMLFSHTAAQRQFHNFLAPLLSALYLTFLPDTPLSSFIPVFSSDLSPREINGIFTSLISYQNSCILINSISDYNQYIFPMESKKIIIIKISEKKHYLSAEIKNALNSYHKYLSANGLNYDLNYNILNSGIPLTEKEKKLLCFTLNEEKRIKKHPKISDFAEFYNIINQSSEELLDLLNDSSFNTLTGIISNHTSAFRPMPEDASIYCIIDNNAVDEFIGFCEKEYEKKAGYKPTFYICDTITSGISKGIIH